MTSNEDQTDFNQKDPICTQQTLKRQGLPQIARFLLFSFTLCFSRIEFASSQSIFKNKLTHEKDTAAEKQNFKFRIAEATHRES